MDKVEVRFLPVWNTAPPECGIVGSRTTYMQEKLVGLGIKVPPHMRDMIKDQVDFIKESIKDTEITTPSVYVRKLIVDNCTCPKAAKRHQEHLTSGLRAYLKAKAAQEGKPESYTVTEGVALKVAETPSSAKPSQPEKHHRNTSSNSSRGKKNDT